MQPKFISESEVTEFVYLALKNIVIVVYVFLQELVVTLRFNGTHCILIQEMHVILNRFIIHLAAIQLAIIPKTLSLKPLEGLRGNLRWHKVIVELLMTL